MNCDDVRALLHPYTDGELELVRHLEVERHLARCPACAERERALRSLRETVSDAAPRYTAPAALRERVRLALNPAVATPPRRRRLGRPVALAACVLLLMVASATMGLLVGRGRSAEDRTAEAVAVAHTRSLITGHATSVASSDRHTVKPWYQGKIDVAPPVPDLTAAGFPLTGGRLDYLTDRPVAALVYARRLHVITVFLWPGRAADEPPRASARQGYHLRSWHQSGLNVWAVSDLGDEELDTFVRAFRESVSAP